MISDAQNIFTMAARSAAVVIMSKDLCICASFILVDFGTSGRRCSRSLLGALLATKLVATISAVIFFSFSPVFYLGVTFSHRRSAKIKKPN